jgi:ACS family tartrate transporter-like MFS transporter
LAFAKRGRAASSDTGVNVLGEDLGGQWALAGVEASTLHKVRWRIVPFLALLYFAAFIDRVSISFAAPQMNAELGFSPEVYGLGAGLFFIGYCLFEVPSNLVLYRVGPRRWIARIMLTWSIVAAVMAFVRGPTGFYILRCLLGIAEAGFFPGVVYYLTLWVPAAHRARLIGAFMAAIPVSTAVGGPLSTAILHLDGMLGLSGWRWLILIETAPSFVLGWVCWFYLRDAPSQASWLRPEEREWLTRRLESEQGARPAAHDRAALAGLMSPRMIGLSLAYFGADMCLYGVVLWLPLIVGTLGMGSNEVGYVVFLAYGVAAAGMVWWSRHSDRALERVWHLALAATIGFLGIGASAFLDHRPVFAIIAITVGALGTLAALPIFWSLSTPLLRGTAAAAGIAFINAVGNVGSFAGPYVIGWIKSITGTFRLGLLSVAGGALFMAIIVVLMRRGLRHGTARAGGVQLS